MNNYDNLPKTNLLQGYDCLLFLFFVKNHDGRKLMRILFQHLNQFVYAC